MVRMLLCQDNCNTWMSETLYNYIFNTEGLFSHNTIGQTCVCSFGILAWPRVLTSRLTSLSPGFLPGRIQVLMWGEPRLDFGVFPCVPRKNEARLYLLVCPQSVGHFSAGAGAKAPWPIPTPKSATAYRGLRGDQTVYTGEFPHLKTHVKHVTHVYCLTCIGGQMYTYQRTHVYMVNNRHVSANLTCV